MHPAQALKITNLMGKKGVKVSADIRTEQHGTVTFCYTTSDMAFCPPLLTVRAPITISEDDFLKYNLFFFFFKIKNLHFNVNRQK